MTATTRFFRRSSALLCGVTLLLLGCSAEPPAPPVKSSSEPTKPVAASSETAPTTLVPWSADTLQSGEFTAEEGFRKLTLADFEPFFAKSPKSTESTWLEKDDAIVCFGKPKGYLYSKDKFTDFTLRLEMRFAPAADESAAKNFNPNSGVMLHINEPHKQWPKSLEVQGKFAELASIKENGGATKVTITDDAAARESARKPVGEWNTIEVVSKAGTVTSFLNGTKICESQPSDVASGSIGLQAEEFEVHFRRLRIRAE